MKRSLDGRSLIHLNPCETIRSSQRRRPSLCANSVIATQSETIQMERVMLTNATRECEHPEHRDTARLTPLRRFSPLRRAPTAKSPLSPTAFAGMTRVGLVGRDAAVVPRSRLRDASRSLGTPHIDAEPPARSFNVLDGPICFAIAPHLSSTPLNSDPPSVSKIIPIAQRPFNPLPWKRAAWLARMGRIRICGDISFRKKEHMVRSSDRPASWRSVAGADT